MKLIPDVLQLACFAAAAVAADPKNYKFMRALFFDLQINAMGCPG